MWQSATSPDYVPAGAYALFELTVDDSLTTVAINTQHEQKGRARQRPPHAAAHSGHQQDARVRRPARAVVNTQHEQKGRIR